MYVCMYVHVCTNIDDLNSYTRKYVCTYPATVYCTCVRHTYFSFIWYSVCMMYVCMHACMYMLFLHNWPPDHVGESIYRLLWFNLCYERNAYPTIQYVSELYSISTDVMVFWVLLGSSTGAAARSFAWAYCRPRWRPRQQGGSQSHPNPYFGG